MRYVLSPCGISLLLYMASSDDRKFIIEHANLKERPQDEKGDRLDQLVSTAAARLAGVTPHEAAKMSAELNGLVKLYEGKLNHPADYHILLCSDTWLGEKAAEIERDWLIEQGLKSATVRRQKDLQTADFEAFQVALSELVQVCEQEVSHFQKRGYHVVFNLTAGFKSVQGFLQTLATIYADESIYVFESGSLLRIPRLPIKMDADQTILQNLTAFRRMKHGLPVDPEVLAQIPETMLMTLNGDVNTSPWFDLIWERSKKDILGEKLYKSPSKLLVYGENFEARLKRLPPDRIYHVNERIADLAHYLETNGKYNPKSLDFKPLQAKPKSVSPSTHEADAWADKDAKRLYGHFEDKVFVLDRLGPKL